MIRPRDVKAIRVKSDGFHSWTEDEIAQFEQHHQIGSRARLALALLLYTGQRRSDVVRIGRQHVRNGFVSIRQDKTGATLEVPVIPELEAIMPRYTGRSSYISDNSVRQASDAIRLRLLVQAGVHWGGPPSLLGTRAAQGSGSAACRSGLHRARDRGHHGPR